MIVILPFEEEFYRTHGVPVTYVGQSADRATATVRRGTPKSGLAARRTAAGITTDGVGACCRR